MKNVVVITTINPKSEGIERFEALDDWHVLVVGDRKSTPIEESDTLTFLSIEDQEALSYGFVEHAPYDHYCRKNIGYLYAIEQGAEVIYDTDDDNLPYDSWHLPAFSCDRLAKTEDDFANIYSYFTDAYVWPRGYPLDEIRSQPPLSAEPSDAVEVGVWQGLADREPDVDAIYRLVLGDEIEFDREPALALPNGVYCPFNSQNTFWERSTFALLYLPSTVRFRFTDILRGYVAQRLLWDMGKHLGFMEATVYQDRNVHNLLTDFESELDCYLHIKDVVETLNRASFARDPVEAMAEAYDHLASDGFIEAAEVDQCHAWLDDFRRLTG